MLVVKPPIDSTLTSITTIEAGLSDQFVPRGQSRISEYALPRQSRCLTEPVKDRAPQTSTIDLLLSGMASAGHGAEALSFYLGLDPSEVHERAGALGLARPAEKPLRRPTSSNPWRVEDVRLLIALWLDKVSVASIAETFGRTPASIHGKRRWLGLGVRDRKSLAGRPVAECRATDLPWRPTFDISKIVARLKVQKAGNVESSVRIPVEIKWTLGRDKEKDARFSELGFAGLRSERIVERMRFEFGVRLTKKAVDNRISRLQIVRDRGDLIDDYNAETVKRRANETITRLGATLRQCSELKRSFWWCRAIGGKRSTCREFDSKKFRSRKAERSCGDVMAMA